MIIIRDNEVGTVQSNGEIIIKSAIDGTYLRTYNRLGEIIKEAD